MLVLPTSSRTFSLPDSSFPMREMIPIETRFGSGGETQKFCAIAKLISERGSEAMATLLLLTMFWLLL
jgi:hypothetical protein